MRRLLLEIGRVEVRHDPQILVCHGATLVSGRQCGYTSGMAIRRLVLVRHAKAETGDGDDAARGLTARGRRDATAIGQQLGQWHIMPTRVVTSPARRAQQTWEIAAGGLTDVAEPVVDDRVYGNSVDDLLAVVRSTPADVETLVVVGHNPSIEEFASELDDDRGDTAARETLADGISTSGIAVFEIDGEWTEVGAGSGRLTALVAPRG
jgi:phosphohistidine phosphatase